MPILVIIAIIIIFNIFSKLSERKKYQDNKVTNTTNNTDNITPTYSPAYSTSRKQKYKKILKQTDNDLPENLDLSEEFINAFNLMENTKDHIFITGNAGTGKSTLLRYFRSKTKKRIVVVASNGIAAINVKGQTIHSFFCLPLHLVKKEQIRLRWRAKEMFESLDAVVIDEVSMVRADVMDGIYFCLKMLRGSKEPFGGVQMIFFGDLFQLPPVVDDRELKEFFDNEHGTEFFFSAKVIKFLQSKPKFIELKKFYRQRDQDFIGLLNRIRNKELHDADLSILNQRVNVNIVGSADHVITLTTTNNDAKIINEERLSKINSKEYPYQAKVSGKFDEKSFPTDPLLKLKKGTQVMLIKNDPNKRWVNGTIGEIANLSDNRVDVMIDGNVSQVPRMSWDKVRYEYNREEKKIEQEVIGSFEQYPLKLAWAITIHKSQGQTFEKVIIDLGNGAFTHGQVYVALSRCTKIEGISLKRPVIHSDVIFDERVNDFRKVFMKHYLDYVVIPCKKCGQKLRFPNENMLVTCPKCQSSFKATL